MPATLIEVAASSLVLSYHAVDGLVRYTFPLPGQETRYLLGRPLVGYKKLPRLLHNGAADGMAAWQLPFPVGCVRLGCLGVVTPCRAAVAPQLTRNGAWTDFYRIGDVFLAFALLK